MPSLKKLIRAKFREAVFGRDKNRCLVCSCANQPLDAHHITDRNEMPNGGYVVENGISLCPSCHEKAEAYHSSGKTEHIPGFHPDDLYNLINSNYQKAHDASLKIKGG